MKDLLITHIKDIDGLSPVILMNLWGKSIVGESDSPYLCAIELTN